MSKVGKLAAGVVAVCGLGYGGYYVNQANYINKVLGEEKAAQKLIDGHQKKLTGCKTALNEQEGRQKTLGQSFEEFQKAAQKAESELETARKQVQRLEQEYEAKQESVNKVAKDLDSIASKITSLRAEAERAASAVTLGEKSLQIARQQAADAKKLLNPLNHPKVLAFMGGRTK